MAPLSRDFAYLRVRWVEVLKSSPWQRGQVVVFEISRRTKIKTILFNIWTRCYSKNGFLLFEMPLTRIVASHCWKTHPAIWTSVSCWSPFCWRGEMEKWNDQSATHAATDVKTPKKKKNTGILTAVWGLCSASDCCRWCQTVCSDWLCICERIQKKMMFLAK